jgi:hypothetical protein
MSGRAFLVVAFSLLAAVPSLCSPRFSVSFSKRQSSAALDGRMLLIVSTDGSAEPRMQINDTPNTQMVFGVDVEDLRPEQPVVIDEYALGYPVRSLAELKPGRYFVQALLHRYETFHRADGHTVKLPMDRGEGQHWNLAPGNLYSKPEPLTLTAASEAHIILDQQIPPIPAPKDTKYVRHVRIKSDLLSAFWGRPMYLGANILVPEGFDEHPEARYPLAVFHGHFP